MADGGFISLLDSDSSDIDSNIPSVSTIVNSNPKSNYTEKLVHSSESDSSGAEVTIQHSNGGEKAKKKLKSSSIGLNVLKANQKKQASAFKLELKQWKDSIKRIKPNTCLKYMSVAIQEQFSANALFNVVSNTLKENGFNYEFFDSDETAITWLWKGISPEFCTKPHLAVIWHLDECISLVRSSSLVVYFVDLMKKKPDYRIYLILHGTRRNLSDQNLRNKVEYALCELELITGVTHSKFYNADDLANFILHLSKSISQELYRAVEEKLEHEKTFYLQGRSRNCAKIDIHNNGMKRLWVQQIAAIYRLPLDSAKVICGHYPTPYYLYETYKNLSSIKEKQDLLKDFLVGRGSGGKRLGPKMSGKIALLFANNNGDLHLSDWK